MRRFYQPGVVCVASAWAVLTAASAHAQPVTYRWGISLGGTGSDTPSCLATDENGNILMAGAFADSVDFDPTGGTDSHTTVGQRDAFVTKLTLDGGYGWTRTWGCTNDDFNWAEGVAFDADGSVMVTGRYRGTTDFDPAGAGDVRECMGENDIFVTRLGPDGAYQWTWSPGAAGLDGAFIPARDSQGDWVTSGAFHYTVDFDETAPGIDEHTSNGMHDVWVAKLRASGSLVWTRTLGGPDVDVAQGIGVDSQDNVIVTGRWTKTVDFDPEGTGDTHTAEGESDVHVTKLDKDGNYLWARTFGGISMDDGWRLAVGPDDAIYIAGNAGAPLGTVGGPIPTLDIDFDPTDGVDVHTVHGLNDLVVQKLNPDGSYAWTYTAGSTEGDHARFVTVTPGGLVVAAGFFQGTVDFDERGSGDVRASNGGMDACVVALDTDGNYQWALTFGGESTDKAECVVPYGSDGLLVAGDFSETMDLDPTGGVDMHTGAGGTNTTDVFVIRLDLDDGSDSDGDDGTGDGEDGTGDGDSGPPQPPVTPMCAAGVAQGALLAVFGMAVWRAIRRRW